ncbi:MAG: GTPase Era [Deltaproteobacteria bacterium]|nr:GTPase Era [Nannocystaceae bacterium]
MTGPSPEHRFGFVAVCGRPNVGKSTLVNAIVGEPVAIATEHPQTTRERMLGIWSQPEFQAVLVDTPGIHRPKSALNRTMVAQALAGCRDVDVVLFLAEVPQLEPKAAHEWLPGDVQREGLDLLIELGKPIVLVLTKIDRLSDPRALLPITRAWTELHPFVAVVPVAALQGTGIDVLAAEVIARLPEGPSHFPEDQLTDRPMRWHVAELIRAELFTHLEQELPYSCAVVVERYSERKQGDAIEAIIYVERDSQRGMVIGKGAKVIKAISMGARARIERLSGRPCDLRVRVDVARDWTRDPTRLAKFGYVEPDPKASLPPREAT